MRLFSPSSPAMTPAGLNGCALSLVRQLSETSTPRDQLDFSAMLSAVPLGPFAKLVLGHDQHGALGSLTVATRRPYLRERLRQDEVPTIIADPELLRHVLLKMLPGETLYFDKRPLPGAPPKRLSRRKFHYHLCMHPCCDPDVPEHLHPQVITHVERLAHIGCPPSVSCGPAYDLRRGWLREAERGFEGIGHGRPLTLGDFAQDLACFDLAKERGWLRVDINRSDYGALLVASAELLRAVPTGVYQGAAEEKKAPRPRPRRDPPAPIREPPAFTS